VAVAAADKFSSKIKSKTFDEKTDVKLHLKMLQD
jgi:hypothetical protein